MSFANLRSFAGILFDAYGTLFDIDTLSHYMEHIATTLPSFVALWRQKQREYAHVRTLIDDYVEYDQITWDALDYVAAFHDLHLAHADRRQLMLAWSTLPLFPDARPMLERVAAHRPGLRRGLLSDASQQTLQRLLTFHDLHALIPHIYPSDAVQVYKPHAQMYLHAAEKLRLSPSEVLLVSASSADLAGAQYVGMRTCRLNRNDTPLEPLGVEPDLTINDLGQLADLVDHVAR